MSNPIVDKLLKHFASQGLTINLLATLSEMELASLTGLDGQPLNIIQRLALKAVINLIHSTPLAIASRPVTAPPEPRATPLTLTLPPIDTASSATIAENEALKAELARLKATQPVPIEVKSSENCEAFKAKNAKMEAEALKIKRARMIKIEEYLSYSRKKTEVALKDVNRMVSEELICLGSSLDICFCIDGTDSMAGVITSVKQCIIKVAQRIAAPGMEGRFALVVYGDYSDEDVRHQIWDFTNSSALERQLGSLELKSGGDLAEDCFGGLLEAATRVSWRAPSRVVVWIGDCPQHGRQYNGGLEDYYPDGDPD
jgi:hypothetical protein